MAQRIRFCEASDGVRLAYAEHGEGPPIVKAAHWMTHLEYDWQSPVWRHWLDGFSRGHRMVRYDGRGCGLSDRDPGELSLSRFVDDLAAVVDAAGLERFALLGASQGGPIAIAYAARHPERVSHLVLYGSYARGRARRTGEAADPEESQLLQSLVRVGWGRDDPVFRRVFTSRFLPGGTPEQLSWFDELQRVSVTPDTALALREVWNGLDVTGLLGEVAVPTLVAHVRGDAVVPFDEGRLLATRIPGAHFLPLEGRNHILLGDEPAWAVLLDHVRDLLGTTAPESPDAARDALSARELAVLRLVAAGLGNDEIAARLSLSVRTVERHLSNSYGKLQLYGRSARAAAAAWVTRSGAASGG